MKVRMIFELPDIPTGAITAAFRAKHGYEPSKQELDTFIRVTWYAEAKTRLKAELGSAFGLKITELEILE